SAGNRTTGSDFRTVDLRQRYPVRFARTKAALPESIQCVGAYNIVFYDGIYYGLPQNPDASWHGLIAQQRQAHGFQDPESAPRPGVGQRLTTLYQRGRRRA